jgi:hypothetical protein
MFEFYAEPSCANMFLAFPRFCSRTDGQAPLVQGRSFPRPSSSSPFPQILRLTWGEAGVALRVLSSSGVLGMHPSALLDRASRSELSSWRSALSGGEATGEHGMGGSMGGMAVAQKQPTRARVKA